MTPTRVLAGSRRRRRSPVPWPGNNILSFISADALDPAVIQSLTASALSAQSATLGSPALTQGGAEVALTATGLSAGTPTEGTPAISQAHTLATGATSSQAPTLGTPGINQAHILTGAQLNTQAPTEGTPALSQVSILTATGLSTGAPTEAQPGILQVHSLQSGNLSTQAPTLGTPTAIQEGAVISLEAIWIDTEDPEIPWLEISVEQQLVAMGIDASPPALPFEVIEKGGIYWRVKNQNRILTKQGGDRWVVS